MGLDFRSSGTEEDLPYEERASWSYGSFGDFRRRLAAQIGITLYEMDGFGGDTSWAPFSQEPLYPLLDHADCEGELSWFECARVWPALVVAVQYWPKRDIHRRQALLLANHMRFCAENKRDLLFC
jgi:hypothetical protein